MDSTALLAGMWDGNGHMDGGWWIVMMVWMLLLWSAVVVGIVWLVRGGLSDRWRTPRHDTPLEVLERRFAEGQMSVEEYRERRAALTDGPGGTRTPSEPVR